MTTNFELNAKTKGDTSVSTRVQASSTAKSERCGAHTVSAKHRRRILAVLVGLLALISVVPSLASAAATPRYHFQEIFGSSAQPEFVAPASMAVDPATGDLLVADVKARTLSRFKPNGEPAPFSELSSNVINGHAGEADATPSGEVLHTAEEAESEAAVAVAPPGSPTAGDIYLTNPKKSVVDVFSSAGKHLTSIETPGFVYPCGVAVGPTGKVYVGDYFSETVHVLAAGTYTEEKAVSSPETCQVAAGYGADSGSFFAASYAGSVTKFDSSGKPEYVVSNDIAVEDMVVDPSSGHLYLASPSGREVREYDVSGTTKASEVSATPLPHAGEGVAVNGTSGEMYVTLVGVKQVEAYGPPAERTVTVTVTGNGTVSQNASSLTSNPPASGSIENCTSAGGADCKATYFEGEEPVFEAAPVSGNHLSAWTVAHAAGTTCTGTASPCEIAIGGENVTATAAFVISGSALTIEKEGAGTVSVDSVQSGLGLEAIACGTHCSEFFSASTVVELTATPAAGSQFGGWSTVAGNPGTCTGTTSPCVITISEAVTLKADATIQPEALTVNQSGPGSVTVECDEGSGYGTCASLSAIPYGTKVKVTATHDIGAEVTSFSGTGSASACAGSTCEFTIAEASSVTAGFKAINSPSTLTVFKAGNGTGTVTSLAPHTGIACGPACEEGKATFAEGQTIELQEVPQTGSVFAGWIGCRHVTATTCQVKLGAAEVEATAVFLAEGKEGPTGATGPEGHAGKEGATGPTGLTGATGKEGATGKAGPTGPTGSTGKQGTAGKEGPQGLEGKEGAEGKQGASGTPGVQGAVGPIGPAGPQGAKGETGAAGKITCQVKQHGGKVKVTCTVKYSGAKASAAAHRTVRWTLLRDGRLVDRGKSSHTPQIELGALRHGRYVLYLQGQRQGKVIHVG